MMKLQYRGVEYDYTPNPVRYGKDYGVRMYRGIPVNLRRLEGVQTETQPVHNLKYRGVSYTTGADMVDRGRKILAEQRQVARERRRLTLARM